MKLIIASNNAAKIREIKEILGSNFDEILSAKEAGIDHETIEDGKTFMENATKKAKEIAEITGSCSLADDSGICVDALNGEPGIYSARFCGHHGDDEANNDLLLKKLENQSNRNAHYTCAMVLYYPDGKTISAEEYFNGTIGFKRIGTNGFGYDPLFFIPECGCTAAELSPEEKNKISHRGKALQKILELLNK